MKSPAYTLCIVLAVCCIFLHFGLLIRIVTDAVNSLPPEKRFPITEYRNHYPEVIRLHKDIFPRSTIRVVWRMAGLAAFMFGAAAVALYHGWVRPTL